MTPKKILFLLRTPPYGGPYAYESIEALLVAAVFDQEVSVLFTDDGVYQLLPNQKPDDLEVRSLGAALKALPAYDVSRLYVAERALQERALTDADFEIAVAPIGADEIAKLIAEQDAVVTG